MGDPPSTRGIVLVAVAAFLATCSNARLWWQETLPPPSIQVFGDVFVPPEETQVAADDRDEIDEVAITYALTHGDPSPWFPAAALCLRLRGQDPAASFVARFAKQHPPLRRASACEKVGWGDWRVATGGPAVLLEVTSASVTTDGAVDVGVDFNGLLSWRSYVVVVRRAGEHWTGRNSERGGCLDRTRTPACGSATNTT